MRPDISSLALFVRIAETKSITKAAEKGHIALAAASRRVAQLEEMFGVQLLYRPAKGGELTPAGTALVFQGRRLLRPVGGIGAQASDYNPGGKGLGGGQGKPFAAHHSL